MASKKHLRSVAPPAPRLEILPLARWWPFLPQEEPFTVLVLPEGYSTLSDLLRDTRSGRTITTTPLLPIAEIEDIDGGGRHYECLLIDRGAFRRFIVPAIQLRDRRKLFELTGSGLDVSSGTETGMVNFLLDYLRVNLLPRRRQTRRVGWRPGADGAGGAYLLERVYPQGEPLTFEATGDPDAPAFLAALRPRGTLDGWRAAFERVLDFPTVVLVVAAACAPLLRELLPLDVPSFWVHLVAGSSTGKTAAQLLALSVWADPRAETQWIPSGPGSYAGFETLCLRVFGLPAFIQETQLIRPQDVQALVYSVGNEGFKARGGDRRTRAPWRGVMISSGELPVIHSGSLAGEAARVITCEGYPFKEKSPERGRFIQLELLPAIREHYGVLGRALLARAQGASALEREKARTQWREWREYFAARASEHPLLPRQASQWAILALAGEWVAAACRLDPHPIVSALTEAFDAAKAQEVPSLARRAYELLVSEMQANARACYRWTGLAYEAPSGPGRVVGVLNESEGFMAMFPSIAEETLRRHFFDNPLAVFPAMKDEGLLVPDGKHRKARVEFNGTRGRLYKLAWPTENGES
jgi:hypothetical protein